MKRIIDENFLVGFQKRIDLLSPRFRDVLIYAFLLPIVLYPLAAVFINEVSLWYASMQERNRDTVYVSGISPLSAAIADGLRRKKHFNIIDDNPRTSITINTSPATKCRSRN